MTSGILALWNDCAFGHEEDYEAWYKDEHLPERLAIPGFKRGRRYMRMGDNPQYFTYYEVDSPDVLTGEAYLERVNNPSEQTQDIMSDTFENMSRTVCTVVASEGRLRGSWAVTAILDGPPDGAALAPVLKSLAAAPGIARAELWAAVDTGLAENAEEKLRGGDRTIAGCVFLETLDHAKAREIAEGLAKGLGQPKNPPGVWRLMCELSN